MKVYLSGMETGTFEKTDPYFDSYLFSLVSFYYIKDDVFEVIKRKSESILVDSGAHTLQKGKRAKWDEYTDRYCEWIKKHDCEKIVGYFEMDVDNIIGYEKVKELRKKIESVTDKCIPVWHKNRGLQDFFDMCDRYKGKWISITGFKDEDIKDTQYAMFYKYAHEKGCKVHCLGMTRTSIINSVPFDSVDSSSWKQQAIRGKVGDRQYPKAFTNKNKYYALVEGLKRAQDQQRYYLHKWRDYE